MSIPKEGAMKVWHKPQIPGKSFEVLIDDFADQQNPLLCKLQQAKKIIDTLAFYDRFQLENNIKPDYSNASGLMIFEGGEWVDWYDENGDEIESTEWLALARRKQRQLQAEQ